MDPVIKVGFCVAYDWDMLKKSIPCIYAQADIICLAIDKDRKSWSGNKFEFDNAAFYSFVKEIDVDKKIIIYEDCFSLPEMNARQNCNRHRMLIAEKMGTGGWHIQIDSDEYFLDFERFVTKLKKINSNPTGREKPINILGCLVPLIKKVDGGYLYVDFRNQIPETAPFATNKPDYQRARQNGHFNIFSPCYVIHETWARSSELLLFKINNWGHASEELEEINWRNSYFNLWKSLDRYNYRFIHNFHPVKSETWPCLEFCEGNTIDELISNINLPLFPLNKFQLYLHNNRNYARLKKFNNLFFSKKHTE